MDLVFKCRCGNQAQVGIKFAGKIVRCKQCGCKLRIPSLPQSQPRPESHAYDMIDEPAGRPMPARSAEPSGDGDPPRSQAAARRKKPRGLSAFLGPFTPAGTDYRWLRGLAVTGLSLALLIGGLVANGERRRSRSSQNQEFAGIGRPNDQNLSLTEARRGFRTRLIPRISSQDPIDRPLQGVFRVINYPSTAGRLAAYLTPNPGDGEKHPAIIWITGGDCNSIGNVWEYADPSNDQTARAFREAGIVMMFPSLRGGNLNPGIREGLLGEVDDVLAAHEFLASRPFVDPGRIYLGGHSTGGTLVLLVAESSDRFRAVFSFGPVDDVSGYGPEYQPYDTSNPRETELRSPGRWLHSVRSPTFVFEGTERSSNLASLLAMSRASTNPLLHFFPVKGTNHFSVLDPVTHTIAPKVLADRGPSTNIAFSDAELNHASSR
ncbi:MAG: alpha/beta hydrolase family protein [Isosphaeraceae bacterium]